MILTRLETGYLGIAIITVVTITVIVLSARLLHRLVVQPLHGISSHAKKMATGDLGRSIRAETKVAEFRDIIHDYNEAVANTAGPIRALIAVSHRIGAGELDCPIEIDASGELGELVAAYRSMRDELRRLVRGLFALAQRADTVASEVADAAQEFNLSTQEIAAVVSEIADGAQQLDRETKETARTMSSLSSVAATVTDRGTNMLRAAQRTDATAGEGRDEMGMLVSKMDRLHEATTRSVDEIETLREG